MPELIWTDAHHEAPTLPPPRSRSNSLTAVEIPRPASPNKRKRLLSSPTKVEIPRGASFDLRASAALPLIRRIDVEDCWSAQSTTTMKISDAVGVELPKPLEKIRILMTQALPLVRINHSDRLARRAIAERAAIVVLACAALVMTMLALGQALSRLA